LVDYTRNKDRASLDAACKTLDAMLAGGIYDQLGGGFFRCTADRWWRQPRCEKLLVLNAEMLTVCLHAWQATQEPRYRRAVEETLQCWEALSDEKSTYF